MDDSTAEVTPQYDLQSEIEKFLKKTKSSPAKRDYAIKRAQGREDQRVEYARRIKEEFGRDVRPYERTTATDPSASETPEERKRRQSREAKRAERGSIRIRPSLDHLSDEERAERKRAQAAERKRRQRAKGEAKADPKQAEWGSF